MEVVGDITTAREEIQAQRDALMVGTHVNRYPENPGEGCLVVRRRSQVEVPNLPRYVDLTELGIRAVGWAAARLGFDMYIFPDEERLRTKLTRLNDGPPGLTASQAIAILDEALLVLKDYEASLPSPKASTP